MANKNTKRKNRSARKARVGIKCGTVQSTRRGMFNELRYPGMTPEQHRKYRSDLEKFY